MALQDWLTELKKPISAGLSTQDLQTQYNQMRNQIQGGWNAGLNTLSEQMAKYGARPGEAGRADSTVGQFLTSGSQALSKGATDVYLDEAKRRQDLAQMNLNRLLGAGGLETQAMQAHAAGAGARASASIAEKQLEWEKQKFAQEFPWQQQMQSEGQLFDLMNMMGGSQNQVYAPWYQAQSNWATQ
jgi:hypothetical protein